MQGHYAGIRNPLQLYMGMEVKGVFNETMYSGSLLHVSELKPALKDFIILKSKENKAEEISKIVSFLQFLLYMIIYILLHVSTFSLA